MFFFMFCGGGPRNKLFTGKKFMFSSRYLNHEKWLELMIWIEFRFDSVSFDSRRLGVTPPQITNQPLICNLNQGKVRGGVARWWFIRSLWLLSQKIKYPPPLYSPKMPLKSTYRFEYTLYIRICWLLGVKVRLKWWISVFKNSLTVPHL